MKPQSGLLIWFILVAATNAGDPSSDLERIQGTWTVASAQEGGKEQADEKSKKLSIVITKDVFSLKFEGQPKSLDMKLKLDPSTKLKSVDLASTLKEGLVAPGIYDVAGDELKICWAKAGGSRPDGFSTKAGDGCIFLTLRRVKKE